jgi:hypothetical protein
MTAGISVSWLTALTGLLSGMARPTSAESSCRQWLVGGRLLLRRSKEKSRSHTHHGRYPYNRETRTARLSDVMLCQTARVGLTVALAPLISQGNPRRYIIAQKGWQYKPRAWWGWSCIPMSSAQAEPMKPCRDPYGAVQDKRK